MRLIGIRVHKTLLGGFLLESDLSLIDIKTLLIYNDFRSGNTEKMLRDKKTFPMIAAYGRME